MQRPSYRAAHQVFRVGAAERLYGLVGIAHQHQPHPCGGQRLEEAQPGQCGVMEIIHHQHRGNRLRLQPHLLHLYATQHRSRLDQQPRCVQTVFARIRMFDGPHVFPPQRERQAPLHRGAVGVTPGAGRLPHVLTLMRERCPQLVDTGQHIPQLIHERRGDAALEHRHRRRAARLLPGGCHRIRPAVVGEVFPQQHARIAQVAGFGMVQMRRHHPAQQGILFGAVQQTWRRQVLIPSGVGDHGERQRRQRGDRTRLHRRPHTADCAIAQPIRRHAPGYRHHGSPTMVAFQRTHQRLERELRLAAPRGANHQQRGSLAAPEHRVKRLPKFLHTSHGSSLTMAVTER